MGTEASAVRLLGAPGLTRDVVAAHLAQHPGIVVADDDQHSRPTVCVLTEPESLHWEAAKLAGAPVVLVAATTLDERATVAAVVGGADAVIDCTDDGAAVVEAVLAVADEGTVLTPKQARAVTRALRQRDAEAGGPPTLTGREAEILQAIHEGQSVKQTADRLGVAAKTVENLQLRLFRKIGARNRAQAVVRAHALGLLSVAAEG